MKRGLWPVAAIVILSGCVSSRPSTSDVYAELEAKCIIAGNMPAPGRRAPSASCIIFWEDTVNQLRRKIDYELEPERTNGISSTDRFALYQGLYDEVAFAVDVLDAVGVRRISTKAEFSCRLALLANPIKQSYYSTDAVNAFPLTTSSKVELLIQDGSECQSAFGD